MRRLLLSKLIIFQLPAVKILLADLQAIPLQLHFPQLNIGAFLRLLLHKQQFQIVLPSSFKLENNLLLEGLFNSSFTWHLHQTKKEYYFHLGLGLSWKGWMQIFQELVRAEDMGLDPMRCWAPSALCGSQQELRALSTSAGVLRALQEGVLSLDTIESGLHLKVKLL